MITPERLEHWKRVAQAGFASYAEQIEFAVPADELLALCEGYERFGKALRDIRAFTQDCEFLQGGFDDIYRMCNEALDGDA